MRSALDRLYSVTCIAACLSMVSILLLVVVQMGSRLIGVVAPGVDEFASYALVATFFLALGPTLKSGGHIRVQLLMEALPPRLARLCDVISHVVGLGLSIYFTFWAVNGVIESYQFDDVGQGMIRTPLWIPQTSMAIGLAVLTIALVDDLVTVLVTPQRRVTKHAESHALEMGEI